MVNQNKLLTSVQFIKGAGPKLLPLLKKLSIETVADFFNYFPVSYEDRRQLPSISHLILNEQCTLLVTVLSCKESKPNPKVSILKCQIQDTSGTINAIWFNQPYLKKLLKPGKLLVVSGKVDINKYDNTRQFNVSSVEIINSKEQLRYATGTIVPVYSLTAGLQQGKIREISREIILGYSKEIVEILPSVITNKYQLPSYSSAIVNMHQPKSFKDLERSRKRLIFQDFLLLQLSLIIRKKRNTTQKKGVILKTEGQNIYAYFDSLPYSLTRAQKKVLSDIKTDISSGAVANRLIQGDVGAGKTEVAIYSLLCAIESEKNAVFMAPTEILAVQHYHKLSQALTPINIRVFLLKGKMKAEERRKTLLNIETTPFAIYVGTHALIQDSIHIPNLGMAVIDEQHRFGVMQRMRFSNLKNSPHCIFLTATPIPRSMMLTTFGDLDKSIINELPPGRIPIKTLFFNTKSIKKVYDYCQKILEKKEQIYIVYPLIEESEKLDLQSAIEGWDDIRSTVFPKNDVGLLHGRMTPSEKEGVMEKFKRNEINILVSTTVIEVGVDVPNATIMIIMEAQRFGLSQLHQLRGRIGRGKQESTCFLISDTKTPTSRQRIKAMIDTTDGFKIAEYDLKIRGAGEVLGTKQSGISELEIADIISDEPLMLKVRELAKIMLQKDPNLSHPQYRLLKEKLMKKYGKFLEMALN